MKEAIKEHTSERMIEYDIARGIGIMAVLLGHSKIGVNLIYAFHMPLFFVISGYFAGGGIGRKIKVLLKSYFVTCFSMALLYCCTEGIARIIIKSDFSTVITTIKDILFASIIGLGYHERIGIAILPAIGPIWYLLALIWAMILLKLYTHFANTLFPAVIIGTIGLLTSRWFWLPWSIQEGMVASIYLSVGFEYHKHQDIDLTKNRFVHCGILGLAILYVLICLKMNSHIDMVSNKYPLGVIDFVGTICCVISVMYISKMIGRKKQGVAQCVQWLGKNTLVMLCVHTIEIRIFPWWVINKMLSGIREQLIINWIVFGIRIILVLGGTYIVNWAIKKYKMRIIDLEKVNASRKDKQK